MTGRACALDGSGDVVAAIVEVTAVRFGAGVVITDPEDLVQPSGALGAELAVTVR